MSSIPNDIKSIDAAREWCRVNGYSEEQMKTMVASWLALDESAPIFVEEEEVDEEWEDSEEWEDDEDEDEDEDLEEDEE